MLLTHGANHAMDLIMRDRLEPGDVVMVDDPGYYPLFGKLRLAKARVVGIRRTPNGPDLDDLAAKVSELRPKLFFTQSLAHNPTGGSLSLPVAHGLLQSAERHDFHIVEDDPFADILAPSSPRLAALDQLRRVLYVGTFSKTLSASLRVGYVAAHPKAAASLADIKLLTAVATSDQVERFVFRLISAGHYLRHIRRLRGRVAEATSQAVADLAAIGLDVVRAAGWRFLLVGRAARTESMRWSCAERRWRAAFFWHQAGCSARIGSCKPPPFESTSPMRATCGSSPSCGRC